MLFLWGVSAILQDSDFFGGLDIYFSHGLPQGAHFKVLLYSDCHFATIRILRSGANVN